MIIVFESEPKFVATQDLILFTPKGEFFIEKDSPIGLLKTEDGTVHIGKSGDVLELSNKTVISDLLNNCQPASFELARNEEGDSYIRNVLLEEKVLIEDKILRIDLRENSPDYTLKVSKIRITS